MKYRLLAILIFAVQVGFGQIYIDSYRFGSAGPTLPNIVTDNLIAWYDASVSSSYPGTGSTWFDLSGNDRDLTIYGATYLSTDGGIFDFDGNDYMERTGVSAGNWGTICFWIKSDNSFNDANYGAVFDYRNPFSDSYGYVGIGGFTGSITGEDIWIVNRVSGLLSRSYTTTAPSLGETWYYITLAHNGTRYQIYVNGVSYTTNDNTSIMPLEKIELGSAIVYNSRGAYLNGKIGEVQIYSDALTASEILQNYNETKTRYGY